VVWRIVAGLGGSVTVDSAAGAGSFTRGAQVAQVAAVAGIGAGAVAGSVTRALPLLVGGGAWLLLGAGLAAVMPEDHFAPAVRVAATRRPRWRVPRSRVLVLLLVAVFFLGLGSEGWDRLGPARLLSFPEVGVLTFGLLGVTSMLGAAALTELLRRRLSPDRVGGLLIGLQLARLAAVAVVALGGVLAAAAGWLVAGLLRAAAAPLLDTWLVAATEPATRATALSAIAQADAAGQILGGPPVGLVGSRVSVPAALLLTGVLAAPSVELFRRARVRRHDDVRSRAGGGPGEGARRRGAG
jgi:DHA3 family tetracycline resistance protein-like MFS transporter